ncbi:MAG: ImmA/IrrE family metallo-endopeptidase [Acidobacteria bacterium]|nr:ImmA/IrrE family metallo-endopeptidase [Acidobacteriota bacterium]
MSRTQLAKQALEKSLEVREEYGYDFRSPLCVYELADRAGVKVQFVNDVSMEGVYAALAKPTVLLSSLRPLTRRAFTCGHELGHHFFGHGSTIDELKDDLKNTTFLPDEFLADTFAGFLLLPAQGVKRAFSTRGLAVTTATPEGIYQVASSFGVGYETIIGHLQYSLRYISAPRANILRRSTLPQVRERILGFATQCPLVIADRHHALGTLDAEVGTLVLLPAGATTDSAHIAPFEDTRNGTVFRALRPGLARVSIPGGTWGVIVRVSRKDYAGLARYRHLEETEGD